MRLLLAEPIGIILAAALIMTVNFEVLLGITAALGIVFIILFGLSRHIYSRQLMQMCYLRRWCRAPLMLCYRPLTQMLIQGVNDTNEAHSLSCISVLLQGHHPDIRKYLIQSLAHQNPKVRLFALEKLSELFWDKKTYIIIHDIFQTDSDLDVQNYALSLLIRYEAESNDKKACETYKVYLKNNALAEGACLGLLFTRYGYMDAVKVVGEWCNSSHLSLNQKALKLMYQKPCPEWVPWIKTFLFHSSETITISALQAAGQLPYPVLLPGIFEALDNLKLREIALQVLHNYGERALPSIEKVITDTDCPLERRKVLIVFLGQQKNGVAKQVLLRVLFKVEPRLRIVIVRTIMAAHMIWVHKKRREIIWSSIQNDVKQWHEIQWYSEGISFADSDVQLVLNQLKSAFQAEMNKIRQLILFQISLLNTHSLVQRSCQLLLSSDKSAYAGAVSCLQDLLPKKMYKIIQPVLLNQTSLSENKDLNADKTERMLTQIIMNQPKWVTPWLFVLALLGLMRLESQNLMSCIEKALKSSNWLILDTALWIVGKKVADRKKAQELMLSVPARYLVQHKFQEFLEGKSK